MKESLITTFTQLYGRQPQLLVRAPGRVNLLGSHTDYNEGWVLPAAIDRAIWLAAAARDDGRVHITSLDFGQEGQTTLTALQSGESPPANASPDPSWLNYPAGVAWAMMDAGYELAGLDAVYTGDVPVGAGVSSSAAVEMAFVLAWENLSGLVLDGVTRARLGQQAENGYLGVASGIMDQFASVHGAADHLILLDCRSLEHRLIAMPPGLTILVADTGVRRQLAHSEYNLRRQQCQQAVEILQLYLPGIKALRDVKPADLDEFGGHLPDMLLRRARHVVEECGRVFEGVTALEHGDIRHFGDTIRRSHISARDLYNISIPELNVLAEAAWQAPGCYGARLTGAGFGGCVVALVDQSRIGDVKVNLARAFSDQFEREPVIFACRVDQGAATIPLN